MSLPHALLLPIFWCPFLDMNSLFISLSHLSTKLLSLFSCWFVWVFSWGQGLSYTMILCLQACFQLPLGNTHYFPADLFYWHTEDKAKGSNHSAHSLDHCVWETSSLPNYFRGSIPRDIWEKVYLPSHHPNPRAAHPKSPFCNNGNGPLHCPTQKLLVTCGNWAPGMVACVTEPWTFDFFFSNLNYV